MANIFFMLRNALCDDDQIGEGLDACEALVESRIRFPFPEIISCRNFGVVQKLRNSFDLPLRVPSVQELLRGR